MQESLLVQLDGDDLLNETDGLGGEDEAAPQVATCRAFLPRS